jgi:hypothetical protein
VLGFIKRKDKGKVYIEPERRGGKPNSFYSK